MDELRAVYFDVGNTLWDGYACTRHVLDIVLPRFMDHLPEDDVEAVIRRFNGVFLDGVRRDHIRRRHTFSRLERFDALLGSYDVARRGLAREMSKLFDATRRFVLRQFLRPDALPVLHALGKRGLRRGLLMNGAPAVQNHLVQQLGLRTVVDHVVLAEAEGYRKPDPRLFRRTLQAADLEPQEMLYVGDSPLTDVLGASRAGIPTVWLRVGGRRMPPGFPPPDFTVQRLGEVLELVEL